MPDFIDYNLLYQRVSEGKGSTQLRVVLPTQEFGPIQSHLIPAVEDESINKALLNSLADDVIDRYERAIASRADEVKGV